jgi:LacI family transcriptional regulator
MIRAITMLDVARNLGVSRTTVSLVLKGAGGQYRIAEKTRNRILAHVRRTGFRPNYFASALTRRRTGVIGLIFPELLEDCMTQVLRGIEDEILGTEFLPMICSSRFDVDRERGQIEQLLHRGVDGLIAMPAALFRGAPRRVDIYRRVVRDSVPLVFLDRFIGAVRGAHRVVQDDEAGGAAAADLLVQSGCSRFAYIGFDLAITTLPARLRGYARRLRYHGFDLRTADTILLREINPSARDLEPVIEGWCRRSGAPDGVLVSTSGLGARCRELFARQGVLPGRDVHVVRFGPRNENPEGLVRGLLQPHRAMGRAAAGLLRASMESTKRSKGQVVCLPVTIDQKVDKP